MFSQRGAKYACSSGPGGYSSSIPRLPTLWGGKIVNGVLTIDFDTRISIPVPDTTNIGYRFDHSGLATLQALLILSHYEAAEAHDSRGKP